jgi:hypothetical protein
LYNTHGGHIGKPLGSVPGVSGLDAQTSSNYKGTHQTIQTTGLHANPCLFYPLYQEKPATKEKVECLSKINNKQKFQSDTY